MFAYCGNNPISYTDSTGSMAVAVKPGDYGSPDSDSSGLLKTIQRKISGVFGTAAKVNAETNLHQYYWIYFTYENGVGYNKSFENDKIITFLPQ